MKIVIIANNSNGLYLFRRQLIQALISKGNTVTILTPFDTDVDNLNRLGANLVETPIDRRGKNPFQDFGLLIKYKKVLKQIMPELVITYTIKPNIYGGLVSRALKLPYAANITGLGSAFEDDSLLKTIVVFFYRISLKNTKMVFFENSANRDYFISEGIVRPEKTYLLNGAGVDLEYFYYQPYPDNSEFRFLFIGRVMKEKGIDELLEAMNRLIRSGVDCSIDILGEYEENYIEKMMDGEKKGWLKYHGVQADVRPYIYNSDCFVLPSYHEGMANTNLECASSGRPIITTNIPGCREAVIDGITGLLCEPQNVDSLLVAMKRMVQMDRKKREKMGLLGRSHVSRIFDKKKVVSETIRQLI